MRRIALFVLPLITLVPSAATALTVRDVVELTRAGLGEDVILALIEVDPSVFPIDTATLKMLKEAGVGERVIVAMVRSGRTQPPPAAAPVPVVVEDVPPPEPQVVVIDHHDAPVVREVPVPVTVPVYVPVPSSNHRVHVQDRVSHEPDPVDAALRREVRDGRESEHSRPSQTFWGFGGQLRPDAWGQPRQPAPPPAPVKKEKDKDKDR